MADAAAGQPSREKVPVLSAAGSPVSPTAVGARAASSRKHARWTAMSTSLTDVAARTALGGGSGGSPEPGRRKATASSRLAVPRASGRPPTTARPASDGGGTTTSCRGLATRLPSAATGSVGAIGDVAAKSAAVLSSVHPGTQRQQQQQQNSKSDHQPAASSSPSSSARLTELDVQFGLSHSTQPDVSNDVRSSVASDDASSATRGTQSNIGCLPVGQEDCRDTVMDRRSLIEDQRFTVADERENYQSFVGEKDSDWHSDNQSVANERADGNKLSDADRHQQNAAADHKPQQCIFDGDENRDVFTDGHRNYQTVPVGLQDYLTIVYEQEECKTVPERQKDQQSFLAKSEDWKNVPAGHGHLDSEPLQSLSDDNQHLVIRADGEVIDIAASTYRDVGGTTSASENDDDKAPETPCSSQLDDVTFPPSTAPASSDVVTSRATGSAINSHSATISGE